MQDADGPRNAGREQYLTKVSRVWIGDREVSDPGDTARRSGSGRDGAGIRAASSEQFTLTAEMNERDRDRKRIEQRSEE
jgi:hypothetical protein